MIVVVAAIFLEWVLQASILIAHDFAFRQVKSVEALV
jgi:hypothetical protein